MIRQKPSLHQRWEGFRGERREGDRAVFSVKRSSMIARSRTSVAVEVYDRPGVEYLIEGCFRQRWCKVLNAGKETVAEIRRKVDPTTSVMLGKEVFWLCVKPGFDAAFAMGLVLVLDEMNGENFFDDRMEEPVVRPAAEDPGLVSPLPVWENCLFYFILFLNNNDNVVDEITWQCSTLLYAKNTRMNWS